MDPHRASMTALAASVMRAVHTRCDQPPLLDEPLGDRLLTEPERAFVLQRLLLALPEASRDAVRAIADPGAAFDAAIRAHPAYAGIIVRARYADDALLAGVARGVRQYVAIAAGMDTFALRHPELAGTLQVIEVDHPATQDAKSQRFTLAGIALPANVHLVAADLERTRLGAVLAGTPFDRTQPALFTVLGLTQYLTRDANLALFAAIADHGAAGSEVIFDYLDLDAFEATRASAALQRLAQERAQTDEPWVSGFDPAELPAALRAVGLTVVEDLATADLDARYCRGRADLPVPAHMHVARAIVAPSP